MIEYNRRQFPENFVEIMADVLEERLRQDAKWGEVLGRGLPIHLWMTVLTEEVGEIAKAILESDTPEIREELVQAAAVCIAMIEVLSHA